MRILVPGLLFFLLLPPAVAGAATPRHVTDSSAPRELVREGRVHVQWEDPAKFTEISHSGNRWEAARGNWVYELADHLADQASARLADGQQLQVTFTDIDLAGDYEPWRGPRASDIRVLRDLYPPRIDLRYQLLDSNGQVIASGEQALRDLGFLNSSGSSRYRSTDSLRHEKHLLDRWLQQLLPDAPARTTNK